MYNDPIHRLYLVFLRPILRDITVINTIFQASNGDITKIHADLRTLIFSIASRIVRPEAMKESRPMSILRKSELEMLNDALSQEEKLLPKDRVYLGEAFQTLSAALALPEDIILPVKQRCAEFLQVLVKELVNRLPNNVETIEKLRFFCPATALVISVRPKFNDLPLELVEKMEDLELLENQWVSLGILKMLDICPENNEPDAVTFWSKLYYLKNAGGLFPLRELAEFALRLLVLPLSNAVVERVFSIMNAVKTKSRNKMSLKMLEAILRVRIYLNVRHICCETFEPTEDMICRFTSLMYSSFNESQHGELFHGNTDANDDLLAITLFTSDETNCCEL
ncbi:uncharacterized protein LOC113005616 isoform X1 [Solenopsis invicta]|uniref:uncharacterized protein LOC113005616 isoform X1 n=1 Tax=Solenopsis invicta TaxID=13686 RepID=UPI000E33DB02|nr:uncharacterized protein LOC113005616 isoform X1 [Solenopsis invicta]